MPQCPECNLPLENPQKDTEILWRYSCANKHKATVNMKTSKVLNVTIPFEPLKRCPQCNLPLKVDFDRTYSEKNSLVRFARYTCSKGHSIDKRQVIQKIFKEATS